MNEHIIKLIHFIIASIGNSLGVSIAKEQTDAAAPLLHSILFGKDKVDGLEGDAQFRLSVVDALLAKAQMILGVDADSDFGPASRDAYRALRAEAITLTQPDMKLTKDGIDMVINLETGGRAYYEKVLKKPSWPVPTKYWDDESKNKSGVTIGVGYDMGQEPNFVNDWKGFIPDDVIEALKPAIGLSRRKAQAMASRLASMGITIPWEAAVQVFLKKTLPANAAATEKAYPKIRLLHPNAQASILSMVYQWGPRIRTTGQRIIAQGVENLDYAMIASGFRKMKGLAASDTVRRETEARYVEIGGKQMGKLV